MAERQTILPGTTKGAFLVSGTAGDWQVSGPFCDGWPINHVIGDAETGRLWAAGGSGWHGPGVWRSEDRGQRWALSSAGLEGMDAIGAGLPSDFGFPVAVHPRDPQTLWVFPLNGDSKGRFPPEAAAAVWRSRDGGESWQTLIRGLPARDCFFTVLRQAMAVDAETPAGVHFGTNSGSVFASAGQGDSWTEIARHLPAILSVELVPAG